MTMLAPGATIGILGSGQLGRMLAVAAAQLGYRAHVYAPESGPANDVSAAFTAGAFDDDAALGRFAAAVDVVTYEFENVAAPPIEALAARVPVHHSPRSLAVAQDRVAEKRFAEALGGRPAPWRPVETRADLDAALAEIGAPAVLKTTRFGYDGKGQARIDRPGDAAAAWDAIGGGPAVVERRVTFSHEFSILLARRADGASIGYPPPWNQHRDGILARSSVPAPAEIARHWAEAATLAGRIADALGHVGMLACEFFASVDGPVFNEMAPRVHNSGHWTIEGAETSQFENHIRAIAGLPLGPTGLTGRAVAMENLIGDDVARVPALLAEPGAHLHLYGKNDARPGRKMGHVTRVTRSG